MLYAKPQEEEGISEKAAKAEPETGDFADVGQNAKDQKNRDVHRKEQSLNHRTANMPQVTP